jgi:vacuolar-type H+-ATPase subunit E/Vma4
MVAKTTNPLTKKGAQLAASKLEQEARKKAEQLNQKAAEEAQKIIQRAADKVKIEDL